MQDSNLHKSAASIQQSLRHHTAFEHRMLTLADASAKVNNALACASGEAWRSEHLQEPFDHMRVWLVIASAFHTWGRRGSRTTAHLAARCAAAAAYRRSHCAVFLASNMHLWA